MALYAFDGTGQKDDNPELEDATDTNVSRFFRAYRPSDEGVPKDDGRNHYQRGVGSAGLLRKVLGKITGFGGRTFVRRALHKLEDNIERNDTIVDVVGFSRGAALALDFVNEIAKGKVKLAGWFHSDGEVPGTVRLRAVVRRPDFSPQHRLGPRISVERDTLLSRAVARRASREFSSASSEGAGPAARRPPDGGVVPRRALRRRRQWRQGGSAARAGQHPAQLDVRERPGGRPSVRRRTVAANGPWRMRRPRCSTISTRSRRTSASSATRPGPRDGDRPGQVQQPRGGLCPRVGHWRAARDVWEPPRVIAHAAVTHCAGYIPCGTANSPAPKLLTRVPFASNSRIGSSADEAQSFAPHRSATQVDRPSRSTCTPLVHPHARPCGRVPHAPTVT